MEKWVIAAKRADFYGIAEKFGIDPVIARLIRNRDVEGEENIRRYLNGDLSELPSYWLLKDMEKAVGILEKKIKEKKKIRIIGDYDIDGVTATYILLTGLRRLGAAVDTYIPDRIADGYGIHEPLILKAREDQVDTILTCDNGIAAGEEIKKAKEWGMTVVVTDHHEIPYREGKEGREFLLPPADALLNPKQPSCGYPNKNICGAAVAWKLIGALYETFGIDKKEYYDFLEFAAIATVGDVMDLQGENRILVKEGLKKLPHTANPGLRALIQANGLEGGRITAYHIGFVLGPCINASGRLDTAARSLFLFTQTDPAQAAKTAGDLTALNASRKALTEKGKEEAVRLVEETPAGEDRVLVLYLPNCHESLAGIIAGRIREKYYKPVFVLTKGEQGVKGSGRSIESYSMFDELVKCADLLEQFGGHPMAAGLSLSEDKIDAFRRRLNENCTLTPQELCPKVTIDAAMPLSYISVPLVEQLSLLEPFGKGNPKPVFAQKGIHVLNPRILGKNRNVVKMRVLDQDGFSMEAVYFGEAEKFLADVSCQDAISITYYPEINCYQGRESLQIVIQNYCKKA
ncbi:MAG TPA: single-stranded-DNA-specific exonuclease RecJ [Candidatus Blautia faecigallinarum]|uniref:Single-stranded-DNA-specific exonuclease RecJ n=1 Tax=Candidatus Blautia faecigallinarum TaxID=2838488 RepID=A0A9D2DR44_9FIRM|nr:single-stranded-DNA-specific exonuclease RecJ [Candidatus Blautia faecigallinarum]